MIITIKKLVETIQTLVELIAYAAINTTNTILDNLQYYYIKQFSEKCITSQCGTYPVEY